MINKSKYILDLFKRLYLREREFDIHYGINNKSKIQIKNGNTRFFENRTMPDLNNVIWKEWQGEQIPFFCDFEDNELITFSSDSAIINFDLIASAFFLLSGWQEYIISGRDKYGRFRFEDSIQKKLDITFKPAVNYYFDILKYAIEKVYDAELKINLWGKNEFGVLVSHDIDDCESAWKQASFWQLKNANFIAPLKLMFQKLFKEDAWFNFDEILALETDLGINSTFHFITDSRPDNIFDNGDYDISNTKFPSVFSEIQNAGSEIALHGSQGAHTDAFKLTDQAKLLPGYVFGNRFHYLSFDIEKSPKVLEKSGLKYDTGIGFAESVGFRSSFCLPYFLYDVKNDKSTSVLEIPLIFMDSSLRVKDYMNVPKENITRLAKELILEIKKFGGIFSINWHNNRLSDVKDPGWKDIFIEIINICKKENALFLTGKGIADQFK